MLARMFTRHPRRSALRMRKSKRIRKSADCGFSKIGRIRKSSNCGADVKAGSNGADVPQSTPNTERREYSSGLPPICHPASAPWRSPDSQPRNLPPTPPSAERQTMCWPQLCMMLGYHRSKSATSPAQPLWATDQLSGNKNQVCPSFSIPICNKTLVEELQNLQWRRLLVSRPVSRVSFLSVTVYSERHLNSADRQSTTRKRSELFRTS